MKKLSTPFLSIIYRARALTGIFLILLFIAPTCRATITVDSVVTTTSTCPNNGIATIYAHSTSDSAVFLYNTVSGPVIYPQQNDSTFYSLYPGTYAAWVHDINSYDSTEVIFTITGTYEDMTFDIAPVPALCTGGGGEIIVAVNNGTGLGPFTWQIIAPDTSLQQANDTLAGLAPGNYTFKIIDGCSETRIKTATLGFGGTGLGSLNYELYPLGCDTMAFNWYIILNPDAAHDPLKLFVSTSAGTTVTPMYASPSNGNDVYVISTLVPGVTYGSFLKICVADICGDTVCLTPDMVTPFSFSASPGSVQSGCSGGGNGQVNFSSDPNDFYVDITGASILTVMVTNIGNGVVVDSFSYPGNCGGCGTFPPLQAGQNYQLTISDNCGNRYATNLSGTGAPATSVTFGPWGNACLDSTGGEIFNFSGFSGPVNIGFLSGPPISASTKPGYAYRDSLFYPIWFLDITHPSYSITNIPAGQYVFVVTDSCGTADTGSFTVTSVSNFNSTYWQVPVCGDVGNVFLNYSPSNSSIDIWQLFNESGGTSYGSPEGYTGISTAVYYSVLPGKYVIYANYNANANKLLPGNAYCWNLRDTVIVPSYDDSTFKATDIASCSGSVFIQVDVDSANGLPPFKYEIISGPETFPPQDSNIFITHNFGTYLIGVIDSCGDVDARQITVDTGRFTPVIRTGGLCNGGRVMLRELASPYFNYRWVGPNGAVYTGDTVIIYPLTNADTGIYNITQIVTINGCMDSVTGTYYLGYIDTFSQNRTICSGDTLIIGPYGHTQAGIYYDTLAGAYGCDSVEITTLTVVSNPVAFITTDVSPFCHYAYDVQLTGGGGVTYYWSGGYADSSIAVHVDTITIFTVTAFDSLGCSATASIAVYPAVGVSDFEASLCAGDTIHIGNGYYYQGGNFTDTLSNGSGCDSLILITLTIRPAPQVSITPGTTPVCHTNALTELTATGNGHSYNWSNGDTAATSIFVDPTEATGYTVTAFSDNFSCTTAASVMVYPGVPDSTVQSPTICGGDTLFVGTHAHIYSGNYADTLVSQYGCDSIVYTHLTVVPGVTAIISPAHPPACHSGPTSLLAIGGNNFSWSNGEGNAEEIIVNPGVVTTYTVTVSNGGSCSATASATVYPATHDSTFFTASLCQGDTFFTGTHAYTQTGNYIDTFNGQFGCDSLVFTNLTVYAAAQAAITPANPPQCHSGPVTLTASGGAIYNWSNSATTSNITVNPATITTYTVTVSNGGSCSATASVLVYPAMQDSVYQNNILCHGDTLVVGAHTYTQTGNYADTLTGRFGCDSFVFTSLTVEAATHATITPSSPPVCHTQPTTLKAGGGTTFVWNPGGNTDSAITVNPATITVYTVTVSDNGLCSATASVTVYPAVDSAFAIAQTKTIVCPGDSAAFCVPTGYSTYAWNNGDTSQCISTSDAGNYYVTATSSFGCSATSNVVHLSLYTPTPVTISVSGDTLTTYPAVSYQWYFDNLPLPGDTGRTIIASQKGTYTVAATDTNGCIYFSSPVLTGIYNLARNEQISVYPNPSNGSWQLAVSTDLVGAQYSIFDAQGRRVFESTIREQKTEISLKLASGVYLMQVSAQQKKYYVRLMEF